MKKIFIFTLGFLLLPAFGMCFQAGPKSQANFGKKNQDDSASAAQAANSQTRSLSTYGSGRTWSRSVQTQGVQTQGVQTQTTGRARVEKEEPQEAPQAPFVDKADGQLSGLKDKIANGGKGGSKPTSPTGKATAEKQIGATQKAEAPKEEKPAEQPAAMPAEMDAVMQQMGQMQEMMNMMGAMGGAGGGKGAGASGAATGAMPAGMPDISALMGSMGAMGGGAPAKK